MPGGADSVVLFSVDEIHKHISHLEDLLRGLPEYIPFGQQFYQFENYKLNADDEDTYGAEGAVNHDFEIIFCPAGRVDGPVMLKERGPGLVAVADTLRKFTAQFPQSTILQKWVFDLTDSARSHGAVPIPSIDSVLPQVSKAASDTDDFVPEDVASDPESDSDRDNDAVLTQSDSEKPTASKGPKRKRAPTQPKKRKGKKPAVGSRKSILDRYVDVDEPLPAKGPGGRPKAPILDEASVLTTLKNDPSTLLYRCIGAKNGCDQTFPIPRNKGRVLKHVGKCSRVDDEDLQQRVNEAQSKESLGAALERMSASSSEPAKTPNTSTSTSGQGFKPLRQPSLYAVSKKARRDELQTRLDHAILKFYVVGGIPPSKVDLQEWKEIWKVGNSDYKPVSSTTMEDKQIPQEAAHVKEKILQHLQTAENLTISFDGGTTKGLESIYTIHVTTAERRVFLWDGNEASDQSHTAAHLHEVLKAAINTIGPQRFRAIGSDNTGNTSGARTAIQEDFPWMFILPDPCHRLSLLAKDICRIEYFHPTINHIRVTVRYFKKSSFAAAHLKKTRRTMGIGRGLVSVGKTRFVTVYFSGESLRRNLRAIQHLCNTKTVKIKDVNHLFLPGFASSDFTLKLDQLLAVLEPIGKSTTCLESSHSTVSDVFIFWLAMMAEIHDFVTNPLNSIDVRIKEEIRRCANYRYNQMFSSNDIYLTGFILDPRYRDKDILRDLNPLAIKKIKLKPRGSDNRSSSRLGGEESREAPDPEPLQRAGQFLLSALRTEYQHRNHRIANLEPCEAVPRLKEQIREFVKGSWPFERPVKGNEGPREWWNRLTLIDEAQPLAQLACNIFAVVPNSMADERTASTFTWLNSHLRARQQAATLVRMTQIRQWYKHDPTLPKKKLTPTVKFRDLLKTLSPEIPVGQKRKRQEGEEDDGEVPAASGDDDENDWDDEEDLEDGWEYEHYDASGDAPTDRLVAGDHADLSSLDLRDLLAESAMALEPSIASRAPVKPVAAPKRTLKDEDWLWK